MRLQFMQAGQTESWLGRVSDCGQDPSSSTLDLTLVSLWQELEDKACHRSFQQQSLQQVVGDLLADVPIRVNWQTLKAQQDCLMPFAVNENNLAVLLRCLTYSGCWISVCYKLDHAVLTISDQVASAKHVLHFSQSNCMSFDDNFIFNLIEVRNDLNQNQWHHAWVAAEEKYQIQFFGDNENAPMANYEFEESVVHSKCIAKASACQMKMFKAITHHAGLTVGDILTIDNHPIWNGEYRVLRVTHQFDETGYSNHILLTTDNQFVYFPQTVPAQFYLAATMQDANSLSYFRNHKLPTIKIKAFSAPTYQFDFPYSTGTAVQTVCLHGQAGLPCVLGSLVAADFSEADFACQMSKSKFECENEQITLSGENLPTISLTQDKAEFASKGKLSLQANTAIIEAQHDWQLRAESLQMLCHGQWQGISTQGDIVWQCAKDFTAHVDQQMTWQANHIEFKASEDVQLEVKDNASIVSEAGNIEFNLSSTLNWECQSALQIIASESIHLQAGNSKIVFEAGKIELTANEIEFDGRCNLTANQLLASG